MAWLIGSYLEDQEAAKEALMLTKFRNLLVSGKIVAYV